MQSSSAASERAAKHEIPLDEMELFNIFRGLSREKLAKIRDIIEIRPADEGEAIIQDGDVGDTFYLLLDGEVEVTKLLVMRMSRQKVDQTDKALIRLSSEPHPEFGKACFGEMALFNENSRRSATVTATRPSKLGVISHDSFTALCEADTEIGYRVVRNIAGELSRWLDRSNRDILNLTTALSFVLASR